MITNNKIKKIVIMSVVFLLYPVLCMAHFGTILTKRTMLDQAHRRTTVIFAFLHPFEQKGMDLAKPAQVKAVNLTTGSKIDLLKKLRPISVLKHRAWKTTFYPRRPGVYCIYMIPKPYWEGAEDIYIKHITKTYVAAFGEEEGWDRPLGLEVEVVPLTRPYGLYAGNVFQGRVLKAGKPVAGCEVEVEYYNKGEKVHAYNEYMVTQVVRTDDNGIFTYAPPHAGWWGFSALTTADYKIKHKGRDKEVEVGAVIWVKFLPWPKK